jgi:DNA-binding MarR family transcriptional regulator
MCVGLLPSTGNGFFATLFCERLLKSRRREQHNQQCRRAASGFAPGNIRCSNKTHNNNGIAAMNQPSTYRRGAPDGAHPPRATQHSHLQRSTDHLGQLLQQLASDFQQRTLVKCRARGHDRIRGSHFSIATCLDETGQTLGELAARVGITQQATGKLLRDLEFGGYAVSSVDARDKRARIIRLTEVGVALQSDLAAILDEIRQEYGALLGDQSLHDLEQQLRFAVLSLPPHAVATDAT